MITRCHRCFGRGNIPVGMETCPRCNGKGKWESSYIFRVLIGLDQLANAILNGDPDETISSRSHKAAMKGKWWGKTLCKWLDYIDPGHCPRVVEMDEGEIIRDQDVPKSSLE